MALLPNTMLPQSEAFGTVNADGTVTITKNWFLLLYNLVINSFGGSGLTGNDAAQLADFAPTDSDIARLQVAMNGLALQLKPPDVTPSVRSVQDATLLALSPVHYP